MSGTRKPWHSGTYHVNARHMRTAATANPDATCWRDGLTLDQHPPHRNGRPPHWQCGHVDDLDLWQRHPSPHAAWIDGRLCSPEASTCNGAAGNRKREPRSEDWYGNGAA